jgi:2-phospho-L-lactate guanylyltransferase
MTGSGRAVVAPEGAAPEGAYRVTAVIPVKPLARAKSRLDLPAEQRRSLALAFALDTVAAVSRSPLVAGVLVVTADPEVERYLGRGAVRVVHDEGAGLRPAVGAGCRAAASWRPSAGVAVVPADLPCLSTDDVTDVLALAQTADGAFVPDHAATGTTLLLCPPGRAVVARYGPGSAAVHRALGLRSLDDVPVRARLDVDTLEDLQAAAQLGLGPRSAAALAATGWRPVCVQQVS